MFSKHLHTVVKYNARIKALEDICDELYKIKDIKKTLHTILSFLRVVTECEALAIRLQRENDFPYYVHSGFEQAFIDKEFSLCSAATGDLECMCGSVVCGLANPDLSFFTSGGSFYTVDSNVLAESDELASSDIAIRGECINAGYKSIALIPIKSKVGIIGLIQVNDKEKFKFDKALILYLEAVGKQIGTVLHNLLLQNDLNNSLDKLKKLEEIIKNNPDCS